MPHLNAAQPRWSGSGVSYLGSLRLSTTRDQILAQAFHAACVSAGGEIKQ